MHLLSAEQYNLEKLDKIFERTSYIKKNYRQFDRELEGKILANLFFEPSTRTRVSFEAAMHRLGGKVINVDIDNSSLKKDEEVENMIKTISQYVDVMVIRHKYAKYVETLAEFSDVPVINAGDGANEHPTQAILDLFTIFELAGDKELFERTNIMFTGDLIYSRTIRSLLILLEHYCDIRICFANKINELYIPEKLNYRIIAEEQIPEYLPGTDVLYMTRNQAERHASLDSMNRTHFRMTPELAGLMPEHGIVLHPLPATVELPRIMNTHPKAAYFKQVKNGMWVRMALLWDMLREHIR